MKKFYIFLLLFLFCLSANAAEFQKIEYKNIKDNSKVAVVDGVWTKKADKKSGNYFVKKVAGGLSNFSEFYSPYDEFLFSTGTQYEFIKDGRLIGYSNSELKFYEFFMDEGLLQQIELSFDEVQSLFPKYKIIKISDFSKNTNSVTLKKKRLKNKVIILNDSDIYFANYAFFSNNTIFKTYELKGFLDVVKKGLIQFSKFGDNTKKAPWFVLVVR